MPEESPKASTTPAVLGLIILAIIWSYSWIVMKTALLYIGAFEFSALRCLLGAALLFVLLWFKNRGKILQLTPLPWKPTLIIGILQTGGMVGLSQWALVAGGAGKTAILVYTMPFWVILLATLFLAERPNRQQIAAIAIAAVGLVCVVQPWHMAGTFFSSLLALGSGLSWGASAVVAKRLYARQSVDLLALTARQMSIGAVLLSVIALLTHHQPIRWETPLYMALAYTAIPATALAWILWLFILRSLPAGVAGLSTLAVPICGILLSWWLLHEVPSPFDSVGMVLIVCALVLLSVPKRKPIYNGAAHTTTNK